MATGRLGASDLSATTNTTIFTVATGKVAAFSVNVCNRNSTAVSVRLALASSDTPSASEWIEYDVSVAGNSVLERTGLILEAGKKLVAYSSGTGVSVVAYGFEE